MIINNLEQNNRKNLTSEELYLAKNQYLVSSTGNLYIYHVDLSKFISRIGDGNYE